MAESLQKENEKNKKQKRKPSEFDTKFHGPPPHKIPSSPFLFFLDQKKKGNTKITPNFLIGSYVDHQLESLSSSAAHDKNKKSLKIQKYTRHENHP